MAGRVNLNVPPRLIESARAAQYANREALNSRELDARIKAKAKQRHAAALRAQPLPDDRVGGVLEFQQRPMGRIRTRRRAVRQVEAGLGWLGIDGPIYLIDTRIYIQSGDGSQTVVFTRRPDNWTDLDITLPNAIRVFRAYYESAYVLPVDEGSFLYLHVGVAYTVTVTNLDNPNEQTSNELFSPPLAQGCVVSHYEAKRVTVPVPAFALRHLPAEQEQFYDYTTRKYREYYIPRQYGFGWRRVDGVPVSNSPEGFAIPFHEPIALSGLTSSEFASSAAYIALGTDRLLDVTPDEVQQEFEGSGGIGQIPVFNATYKQNWYLREPGAEILTAGLLPDVTIFDPALQPLVGTIATRAPYLLEDDQAWYWGNSNVVTAPSGPVLFGDHIISYDYHGGTYCRDKLAELGITL